MAPLSPDPSYLAGLPKYLSFVDEAGHSKDPRQNYLGLAGLIAPEEAWRVLGEEWMAALCAEGITGPFHMKDFAARRGGFEHWTEPRRKHLLGDLISAIERSRAAPVGSVVSLRGFDGLSEDVRKGLKDPHFMAFQTLTYQIAVAAFMTWPPGPVTMVYAHHPEHSKGLGNTEELWIAVRKYNPMVRMFMEAYVCGEPKDYAGLQAADLWAYELRHHFESIRPSGKAPRWPFEQFVRMGLNYSNTHDFISYHDENGLSGLGQMSRVQRLGEIDLYRSGFTGMHPAEARKLDIALRKIARAYSLPPPAKKKPES